MPMMLLISRSVSSLLKHWDAQHMGTLTSPRHAYDLQVNHERGIPWAADNDCFNAAKWDEGRWYDFVAGLEPFDGCLWVALPDVLGDFAATLDRADTYLPAVAAAGKPVALVAQDGLQPWHVPWLEIDCLFLGGSTAWKESPVAERLARTAKDQGKLLHMGRVNTLRRLRYAHQIGCDTVDGTSWSRWTDTNLPRALSLLCSLDRQTTIGEGDR